MTRARAVLAESVIENTDLQPPLIKEVHTDPSTYGEAKQSNALPIGVQQEFVEAAILASDRGAPLNTLLTVRWRSLFSDAAANEWRTMEPLDRVRALMERIRKWVGKRDITLHYIWVREASLEDSEHWHLALHLPRDEDANFADYVAKLLGEPKRAHRRTRHEGATTGEFACGECNSWHLARDTEPHRAGRSLAEYLGKGEPSERTFRGQVVANSKKLKAKGKYSSPQGVILGNNARFGRYDIARSLKKTTKLPKAMQADASSS